MWLAQGHASLGQTLELVAGVAFVTWAWTVLGSPRNGVRATQPAAPPPVALTRRGDCRLERTPPGRLARDLRCPASRAAAPARRSTRR